MKNKTLIVLGASSDQLFLIKTAQAMGLRVLAIDKNPHSVGFQLADDFAVISTRDVTSICQYVTKYQQLGNPIAGVITMGSDIPDIVAAVCQYLGLESVTPETASLCTNKFEMKVQLRDKGIPTPWFQEIYSPSDIEQIAYERGYPLIIKPIDRSGSRGVFYVDDKSDLVDLFNKSKDFAYSGRVQLEEYLHGLQISTETVMYRGKGLTPGFADRNYEFLDRFKPQIIENGGWMPTILSEHQRLEVEDLVVQASLALGITDGVSKGDVVITDEGPKIIEIAARLSGGDFCESLVPLNAGINYVEAVIRIAIGEEPDLTILKPKYNQSVANRYFIPSPGKLVAINGAEEVLKENWLKKLEFWYKPGDEVPPPLSHAHRFGVFVVVGDNREEVAKRVDWVYKKIKIIIEK